MNAVSRFRVLSALLVLILMVTSAIPTIYAQEATEVPAADVTETSDPATILCEASVMLLAGLATRDYGYVMPTEFDILERGQFAFLFGDDDNTADATATEEADTTEDETDTSADATATEVADLPAPLAVLVAPAIVDEDVLCTQLRTNVLDFFATRPETTGAGSAGGASGG